jgi:hypothetical protein
LRSAEDYEDAAWRVHALEHFRDVASDNATSVFSMGPCIAFSPSTAAMPLDVALGPPGQSGSQLFAFQNEPLDGIGEVVETVMDVERDMAMQRRACNILCFQLLDADPGRHKTVTGVSSEQSFARGPGNPIIVPMDILEVERAKQRILVALESVSGGPLNAAVLPLRNFTRAELKSLRIWERGRTHHWIASAAVKAELREAAQRVADDLVSAGAVPNGEALMVPATAEPSQHEVLQALWANGLVDRTSTSATFSGWRLTPAGARQLQAVLWVTKPLSALRPRGLSDPAEWNTFELMMALEARGWACRVKFGRDAKPVEYDPSATDRERAWWVKPSRPTVHQQYLLCLHTASDLGRPVKHFQPLGYYQCLLKGREYRPHALTGAFAFQSEGDGVQVPTPSAKRRRRALHGLPSGDADANADVEDDEGQSQGDDEGETGGDTDDGSEHSEAPSSGQSASQASSSSDSSSEDSSSGEDAPLAAKPDLATEPPPATGPPPARQARAPRALGLSVPSAQHLGDAATHFWKGCKFTPTFKKNGEHKGWEATCYRAGHERPCRRTLTFVGDAGQVMAVRRLKWWCLEGSRCATKQAHQGVPHWPAVLPELADLDEADVGAAPSA